MTHKLTIPEFSKSKQTRETMEALFDPDKMLDHLALKILLHLDDKSLANCRSVCQTWKAWIDEQKFFYLRQTKKMLRAEKYEEFLDEFSDWRRILAELNTSNDLTDLRKIVRFLTAFFTQFKPMHYTSHDPLQWIVSKNQVEDFQWVFQFVQDLNGQTWFSTNLGLIWDDSDQDQWTALMTACAEGYMEIVKFFMENCQGKTVDFNMTSGKGRTALMLAVMRGEIEIVKLFLDHAESKNIDLNALDDRFFDRRSAIFYAVTRQQDQILDLLMQDSRVSVNLRDGDSNTPFIWACEQGYPDVLQVFFKHAKSRKIGR